LREGVALHELTISSYTEIKSEQCNWFGWLGLYALGSQSSWEIPLFGSLILSDVLFYVTAGRL